MYYLYCRFFPLCAPRGWGNGTELVVSVRSKRGPQFARSDMTNLCERAPVFLGGGVGLRTEMICEPAGQNAAFAVTLLMCACYHYYVFVYLCVFSEQKRPSVAAR